ncbi:hypothetical protein LINGRAPRIM_LOCUS3367 [Linum grandiflorum]
MSHLRTRLSILFKQTFIPGTPQQPNSHPKFAENVYKPGCREDHVQLTPPRSER